MIAGAAAAAGLSLSDVFAEAKNACEIVGTMGVALSVCTLPGQFPSDRLGPSRRAWSCCGGPSSCGLCGFACSRANIISDLTWCSDCYLLDALVVETSSCLGFFRFWLAVDLWISSFRMLSRLRFQHFHVKALYWLWIDSIRYILLGATPLMELMIATGKAVAKLQLEHGTLVLHESDLLSLLSFDLLLECTIATQLFWCEGSIDAEVVFLQVLNFEIGVSRIAFVFLEDLLIRFREISTTGGLVNFEACMDVMDLLYETEATSTLCRSPASLAAAVLVAAYAIAVPKQQSEFPILSWVKFAISLEEEEVGKLVRKILTHVLNQPVE
ncbi:hypothetical protein Scep_022699 [Stephania cephalantha]|uniref:Uncharacterized protein n=1 Tax=Stephania cephalantha TaxID=152367 RepID=A0AAP0I2G7_9MAGN